MLLSILCRVGVTSAPQHMQLELTPADKVLVLASDGECGSSVHLKGSNPALCAVDRASNHVMWVRRDEVIRDGQSSVP